MSIRHPTDKLIKWPWKKLPFSEQVLMLLYSAEGAAIRAYFFKNLSETLISAETVFEKLIALG